MKSKELLRILKVNYGPTRLRNEMDANFKEGNKLVIFNRVEAKYGRSGCFEVTRSALTTGNGQELKKERKTP